MKPSPYANTVVIARALTKPSDSGLSPRIGYATMTRGNQGRTMDRDTLKLLLNSGRFLCYNPNTLDGVTSADIALSPDQKTGENALFDSPILEYAVFFKEARVDANDDYVITTRVMLPFNENNAEEGGASVEALPEIFEPVMDRWFGQKVDIRQGDHDRNVLEVLCRTPTFDPFLLSAQRHLIERDRKVDPKYFSVDLSTGDDVRAMIGRRTRKLIQLALGANTPAPRVDATMEAVEEAVWNCQSNQRTASLFESLRIPESQVNRILFAWKGISYYEHLFQRFGDDYKEFLLWLGDPDSLPRDTNSITVEEMRMVRGQRNNAQTVMRGYYVHATEILQRYDRAYLALVEKGTPEPFQKFLQAAPNLFETLGLSIGAFGHANNAWLSLTNDGRRRKRKASSLTPFFRFVAALATTRLGQ